jgi:hypothetical protein
MYDLYIIIYYIYMYDYILYIYTLNYIILKQLYTCDFRGH